MHYNGGAGRISYHYYVDFQHLNDGLCVVTFTTGDLFVSQGGLKFADP